jgi:hypothetical protein
MIKELVTVSTQKAKTTRESLHTGGRSTFGVRECKWQKGRQASAAVTQNTTDTILV